jgi:catechol 2,3-dioxygenase-like lactoylglutathione lyase family enzyme
MSTLNLAQVGRVCVTVADTDRAIDFYVNTLGFEKVVDTPMGDAMRWVEVALPGTVTTIALAPPPPGTESGGSQTGICLDTSDVDADHATLKAAGVDVDAEVTRWGRPCAADVLATRPGCELADRRSALDVTGGSYSATKARPASSRSRVARVLLTSPLAVTPPAMSR